MSLKIWYLALLVVVIALIVGQPRQADAAIVTDDLLLWLDAGNAGNGVGVLGSGATWHDLSSSGTHDTALVGAYSWLGTGTPADPFRVNFTQTPPYVYPSSAQAYGRVANSGEATELDTTIFTYEVWAEINGPGTGEGNSEVFFPGVGTLIGHASDSQYGNGGISYTTGGSWGTPPDRLFGGNADYGGSETPFPNSGGLIGDGLLHHIVHTRAGAGATDSAWYLDGVLQGTFATTAKESYADLGIGANHRGGFQAVFDKGANADFAQVRVYDRPLTAAEVLQNFNTGLTAATTNPPTNPPSTTLTLVSTEASSLLWGASYLYPSGPMMIKQNNAISSTNGQTWTQRAQNPNFDINLPSGWHRGQYAPFVDPVNGNIVTAVISLDVATDPNDPEPHEGLSGYYLRYRVSTDGGATFLFDDPVVQSGMTAANPFDGVITSKNGWYIGDGSGDRIIRTQSGRIIIPAQAGLLDSHGDLFEPPGVTSYHQAMMILGDWQPDNTIQWTAAKFINGDPTKSTRGMIEPTITQFPDGRLLAVMRGSNESNFALPSYKWFSISSDDGDTWTTPQAWTYDDGSSFFSAGSVSHLMQHSSGRFFWIGNINPTNPLGNLPRYPLVIGEVDGVTLKLIKNTVLEIDTKHLNEPSIVLSHMWAIEDRYTNEIVITGQRCSENYATCTPVTYRIDVNVEFDPADFNQDSLVDGDDLAKWQGDYGVNGNSDADGDGDSDGRDFLIWQRSTTSPLSAAAAVPEPSTFGLLTVATCFGFALLRKRAGRAPDLFSVS